MRARHTKFNKIATTITAGLALVASIAGGTVLVLHNEGVIDMHSDAANIYRAQFYVDDSLVYETYKARGEEIGYGYEEIPVKDCDVDGQLYVFVGWDLTGEGIPDVLPNRIYSNFKAHAVFAKFGIPDIDWTKVDFNQLLDLLNYLNIDLEAFMNFFGLSWEDMLELLDIPIINYKTDYKGLIYLRNESFGSYNSTTHKWGNADYYLTSNISSGSVNPLEFAINKTASMLGEKANTKVDLEYLKKGNNYPVMCYEKDNHQGLNSESYSLTSPANMKYHTEGVPYSYVTSSMIPLMKQLSYSSDAIRQDEIKYRNYVRENYLDISDSYKSKILAICAENGIVYDDKYTCIDAINKFFKNNYKFDFRMPSYPLTCDPPMYFLTDAKVGIGRHFAAATTLMYRALGIPARYVQGYVDYAESDDIDTIAAIQAHSWCEIYVDEVGWLAVDTSIQSISPVDLGFLFSTENVDELDFEAPGEGNVIDFEARMKKDIYDVGEEITIDDIVCHAIYDSGDRTNVRPSYTIPQDLSKITSTLGEKEIQVFYDEGGNIFMKTVKVNVDGGQVKGKIALIPKEIQSSVYDGIAHYDVNNLFKLVDDNGDPLALRDGDSAILYPVFMGEAAKYYTSLEELIYVGVYAFRMNVQILDKNKNDVTKDYYNIKNSYTFDGKKASVYSIAIDPYEVRLGTGSKSISYNELMLLPYLGNFTYQAIYNFDSIVRTQEVTRLTLINSDYIDVTKIDGWAVLHDRGHISNTFDISSIKVYHENPYGEDIDVTKNYHFTLSSSGTIGVN